MDKNQMEILKAKMKVKSDDINDIEKMMEYAEMAKGTGDMEAAQWFHRRAKNRWGNYEEADRFVDSHIDKMKASGNDAPNSVQGAMFDMFMSESKKRAKNLEGRLESFSSGFNG